MGNSGREGVGVVKKVGKLHKLKICGKFIQTELPFDIDSRLVILD